MLSSSKYVAQQSSRVASLYVHPFQEMEGEKAFCIELRRFLIELKCLRESELHVSRFEKKSSLRAILWEWNNFQKTRFEDLYAR